MSDIDFIALLYQTRSAYQWYIAEDGSILGLAKYGGGSFDPIRALYRYKARHQVSRLFVTVVGLRLGLTTEQITRLYRACTRRPETTEDELLRHRIIRSLGIV